MRRGAKPAKAKADAKLPVARKPRKNEGSSDRQLEKRLAEVLKREAEALEQQKATGEILRMISSSPMDPQPVLDAVVRSAARFCGAYDAAIFRLDGGGLRLTAHHGPIPSPGLIPVVPGTVVGRSVHEGRAVHVVDLQAAPEQFPEDIAFAREFGHRTALSVPLLREGTVIGAINLRRAEVNPFTDKQIALLGIFADQAVIAIEHVRLFSETRGALERQTATSEILRVISRCQTDVQPVFDAIAAKALDLCRATTGWVYTFDGALIHVGAAHGLSPEGIEARRQSYPMPPSRGGGTSRAVLSQTIVYIPDIRKDHEYTLQPLAKAADYLSVLAVPMLREGKPIGVITVTGAEAGAFSQRQIELLETFADQAVIAIENVRLFKELRARTAELTRSVGAADGAGRGQPGGQLDVGRRDGARHDRLARQSARSGRTAARSTSTTRRPSSSQLRATHNCDAAFVEAIRAVSLRKGEGLMGRATEMREPVQIPDITQPEAYQSGVRDTLIRFGYRALLSVPLLREDQIIGSLSLNRKAPGEFPSEVDRRPEDLRHPVGPGHPERPTLPRDRGQEPAARGGQPPQVRVPGQHVA